MIDLSVDGNYTLVILPENQVNVYVLKMLDKDPKDASKNEKIVQSFASVTGPQIIFTTRRIISVESSGFFKDKHEIFQVSYNKYMNYSFKTQGDGVKVKACPALEFGLMSGKRLVFNLPEKYDVMKLINAIGKQC